MGEQHSTQEPGGKHDLTKQATQESGPGRAEGEYSYTQEPNDGGRHDYEKEASLEGTRCTYTYMRTLRRLKWEREMDWDMEDEDRLLESTEVLEEDLQDFSVPMVIVGSAVVSLYPNLVVDKIIQRVEEEVIRTDMKFENVDYLEATRYLALNWSQEECRKSPLRRVLPWRRKRKGTGPGITGEGPMGRERGDQEHWEFPQVVLEGWEKKQIIASVLKVATETMFRKHYSSFGGEYSTKQMVGAISSSLYRW